MEGMGWAGTAEENIQKYVSLTGYREDNAQKGGNEDGQAARTNV
jgi:hypothetical protein